MTSIPSASGIYRITCTVTKKFYLGSSINLHRRWNAHCNELRRNKHGNSKLQRAWNKYGESAFLFEVIELVLPLFLLEREQYWLDKLKPFGNKGFNIARSAQSFHLGLTHSIAIREKLRISHLGQPGYWTGKRRAPETLKRLRLSRLGKTHSSEVLERIRVSQLGKTHSPESKEKIRLTLLGHPVSEASRAKMHATGKPKSRKTLIVIAPDGTEQIIHGIQKFCKEHHLHHGHLIEVASGKRTHHKGWKARFPD